MNPAPASSVPASPAPSSPPNGSPAPQGLLLPDDPIVMDDPSQGAPAAVE